MKSSLLLDVTLSGGFGSSAGGSALAWSERSSCWEEAAGVPGAEGRATAGSIPSEAAANAIPERMAEPVLWSW